MTLTRIVRTGLSRTVSTPAIPAQWTTCVAPANGSSRRSASSTSPWTNVKFGCSASAVPPSESRCRLSTATISFVVDEPPRERRPDEPRAARDHDRAFRSVPRGESSGASIAFDPPLTAPRSTLGRCALVLTIAVLVRRARGVLHRIGWVDDGDLATVTYWEDGADANPTGSGRSAATPPRGSLPRPGPRVPAARGRRDEALRADLAEDVVCTEIYGGPQRARVIGTVDGKRVWANFTRTNGCQIGRWDRALAVALPPGGVTGSAPLASPRVTTVLFVGAGRHQRRAIEQARARGLRVVAVDRNAEAPGSPRPTSPRSSTSRPSTRCSRSRRRVGVDGVLTVSADRAVPVVAAVAEELGLPGIGTHDRAPPDAQARDARRARRAPASRSRRTRRSARRRRRRRAGERPGFPAVLKPVDSGGQRAVFRVDSSDELERDLRRRDRRVADRRGDRSRRSSTASR